VPGIGQGYEDVSFKADEALVLRADLQAENIDDK